jgi:hypothetical protein
MLVMALVYERNSALKEVAIISPDGSSELWLMRSVVLMRSLEVAAASAHLLAAWMAYSEARLVLVIIRATF